MGSFPSPHLSLTRVDMDMDMDMDELHHEKPEKKMKAEPRFDPTLASVFFIPHA